MATPLSKLYPPAVPFQRCSDLVQLFVTVSKSIPARTLGAQRPSEEQALLNMDLLAMMAVQLKANQALLSPQEKEQVAEAYFELQRKGHIASATILLQRAGLDFLLSLMKRDESFQAAEVVVSAEVTDQQVNDVALTLAQVSSLVAPFKQSTAESVLPSSCRTSAALKEEPAEKVVNPAELEEDEDEADDLVAGPRFVH